MQAGLDSGEAAQEIYQLTTAIADEEAKFQRYKVPLPPLTVLPCWTSQGWQEENLRRKHNYVPFIVEMLKVLARERKLLPLVQEVTIWSPIFYYYLELNWLSGEGEGCSEGGGEEGGQGQCRLTHASLHNTCHILT